MNKQDQELIDEAYSTTYKATIKKLIKKAKSKEAKDILNNLYKQAPE